MSFRVINVTRTAFPPFQLLLNNILLWIYISFSLLLLCQWTIKLILYLGLKVLALRDQGGGSRKFFWAQDMVSSFLWLRGSVWFLWWLYLRKIFVRMSSTWNPNSQETLGWWVKASRGWNWKVCCLRGPGTWSLLRWSKMAYGWWSSLDKVFFGCSEPLCATRSWTISDTDDEGCFEGSGFCLVVDSGEPGKTSSWNLSQWYLWVGLELCHYQPIEVLPSPRKFASDPF